MAVLLPIPSTLDFPRVARSPGRHPLDPLGSGARGGGHLSEGGGGQGQLKHFMCFIGGGEYASHVTHRVTVAGVRDRGPS